MASQVGCQRIDCVYLHDTPVLSEIKVPNFKCVSCMDTWIDEKCVVKHTIKDQEVFFWPRKIHCQFPKAVIKLITSLYDTYLNTLL